MIDTYLLKDLWIQIVATVLGTLMAVSCGMNYGWTSPMIPYLMSNQSHIPITQHQGDFFETVFFMGAAIGLPFSIFTVSKFGRKGSMLIASAIGCVCWFMVLFTRSVMVIYVARFFAGIAGNMVFIGGPMYIAEISDPKIRGFMGASIYTMLLIGFVIVYSVGSMYSYESVPIIGIVVTAVEVIFFPFMPESPYYFIYNEQMDKARKSLARLRSDKLRVDKEMAEIKAGIERQKSERGRFQDLILIKSNRKALSIMFILNIQEHLLGISVILMNIQSILEEAGSKYMEPSMATILFAVIMLVFALIASAIMDRFGRRFLLIASGTSTCLALLVMTVYYHLKNLHYDVTGVSWIPIACVMLYAATFKLGVGIVPVVVTGEIFSSRIKAIGMTVADLFYVLPAIATINIYSFLYATYGIHVPFYLFSVSGFVGVVVVYLFVPETKGKTLEEIQLMLKGKNATNGTVKGDNC